jgi:hypothetical protein
MREQAMFSMRISMKRISALTRSAVERVASHHGKDDLDTLRKDIKVLADALKEVIAVVEDDQETLKQLGQHVAQIKR